MVVFKLVQVVLQKSHGPTKIYQNEQSEVQECGTERNDTQT